MKLSFKAESFFVDTQLSTLLYNDCVDGRLTSILDHFMVSRKAIRYGPHHRPKEHFQKVSRFIEDNQIKGNCTESKPWLKQYTSNAAQ